MEEKITTKPDNINIHTHLIGADEIPAHIYFQRFDIPKFLIDFLEDTWKEGKPVFEIIEGFAELVKDTEYNLVDFLKYFFSDWNTRVKMLLAAMDKAGVTHAVVLMLDLETCGVSETPWNVLEDRYGKLFQESNGRLLPFYFVDPRRKNVFEEMKKAFYSDDKNFFGIKMYPPLGYSPDHESSFNSYDVNETLKKVYEWAGETQVPILTHCSAGGIRGDIPEETAKKLANPDSWFNPIMQFEKTKFVFGHFGGNSQFMDYFVAQHTGEKVKNGTARICAYMQEREGVFGDISFANGAIDNRDRFKIAINEAFDDPFVSTQIVIGSDFPLTIPQYTDDEFYAALEKEAGKDNIQYAGDLTARRVLDSDFLWVLTSEEREAFGLLPRN